MVETEQNQTKSNDKHGPLSFTKYFEKKKM